MAALLGSMLLVAFAEIGDKTQLLALLLVIKFRKPIPIIVGILGATILNHLLASYLGIWLSQFVRPEVLTWSLAATFLIFSVWILYPDKEPQLKSNGSIGPFFSTFVVFFLAEMGDKTQLATIALGARYENIWMVTIGTTLGMMIANAPVVFWGDKLLKIVPMKFIRWLSAALFFLFAAAIAWNGFIIHR